MFLADLFTPNAAFEVLMKKLIQKMEEPATRCVDDVQEQLKQVLEDVTSSCNEIGRFQELKEKVNQECMRLLRAKTKEAGGFVTNIVDMEKYNLKQTQGFDEFHRSAVEKEKAYVLPTASCQVDYLGPAIGNGTTFASRIVRWGYL